ncbi:MAG: hypothetical protein KIT84_43415 [Labilithrix sp.]|nr:hypothetical protein [Labilithrix sp.]MCW5817928.1 hypothetical protein [Labilithrix sp.]
MATAGRLLPLLPLVLLACGSPPPGPVAPPAPAVPPAPKEPPIDVSSVPEPPNLVVVGRVSRPENIVHTVGSWTKLPLPGARELLRSVQPNVADVIDVNQPVDAAGTVTLGRHGVELLYAFSVGVKSFEDAKTRLALHYRMDPVANGGFKVHGIMDRGRGRHRAEVEDDDDGDDEERDVCVLAHSSAGAKLVCGPGNAVDALTPYLSRTMPRERWPADVHLELRPEPVRAPLQEMRRMLPEMAKGFVGSQSTAVRALIDASVGEALDIVDDAQKLSLDGTIDDSGILATSRFELQGQKSLFARALTDASRADDAPAAFWHLPGDTDTALFMRGSDPKLYEHPREILTALLVEGLDAVGLPAAEKKTVHDLVADRMLKLFTNGGTGIYAKGFDQAALEKAIKARGAVKEDDWTGEQEAKRVVGEQVVGWHMYQVSEPVAKVGPILKDWSGLWNRPAFSKWFTEKTGTSQKTLPKMRVTPFAGVSLPKETVHLEVSIPNDHEPPPVSMPAARPGQPQPKAPPAPKRGPLKPIVLHLFAVPDGASTWLAFGLDGKLVATKAAAALASATDAGTLGKTAQGVEPLKEGKINGGALFTMRGLLVLTAFDDDGTPGGSSVFSQLGALPAKGGAPIVLTSKAEAPTPQARAGASTGQLRVTRAVIEDVVKLLLSSRN